MPTLDEESALASCLASVGAQEGPFEILVCDGGSVDGTAAVARRLGARWIDAPRGRGAQLNAGSRSAAGDIFLFLHADTLLPSGALAGVRAAVSAGADAGALSLRFDCKSWPYELAARLGDWYCRCTGERFGDRAMFVTRSAFEAAGGFRSLPVLEDLDLCLRLRQLGFRSVLLPQRVITSARRFAGVGIWRGGWWAWKLVRDFRRGRALDAAAARFYAGPARGTEASR